MKTVDVGALGIFLLLVFSIMQVAEPSTKELFFCIVGITLTYVALKLVPTIFKEEKKKRVKVGNLCGHERPPRKVLCQLEFTHEGSHSASIFWEDEP